MKKTLTHPLIALALAGAFAPVAHAQSSVTLYGSLDAGVLYVNNAGGHNQWLQNNGGLSNTYFGLRGAEDLGGGRKAIFRLQSAFSLGNGAFARNESGFNRMAYVGLQDNVYGTLTVGRQFDSIIDYLTPLSLSGTGFGVNLALHPLDNDSLSTQRSTANAVKFESANYAGFHFGGSFGFSNDKNFSNGRAWSVGAGYENGPLSVATAYDQSNNSALTNPNGAAADDSIPAGVHRTFGVGAHYVYGPAAVGVLWTHSKIEDSRLAGVPNDIRFDNVELNGTYALTPSLALLGGYTYTFGKTSSAGSKAGSPKWHSATLAADYSLSKRTDVYLAAVYQHASGTLYDNGQGVRVDNTASVGGLLTASSTGNQVGATFGVRHRF
ncbi:porin [Burkholderia sp. 22PA0106]|uniref:porin n=1 Tax=Burkholderia sp. 22PA0106 TaxID=3237371 RepID=UPI0039C06249